MALPSTSDSPSPAADTPAPVAPYRLDTSAVLLPVPVDTATLVAIRERWNPRPRRRWEFELRPWHYAVALAAVFGCTVAVVIVVLTHAAVR